MYALQGLGRMRFPIGPITPPPPPFGAMPFRGKGFILPPITRACMLPFMLRRMGPPSGPWRMGGGIMRPIPGGGGIGRPPIGGIGGGIGLFIASSDIGPGGPAPNRPFCGPRIRIPLRKWAGGTGGGKGGGCMGPRRPAGAGGPGNMFGGAIGPPQLGIPFPPPFIRCRIPPPGAPFFMGRFIGTFILRLPLTNGALFPASDPFAVIGPPKLLPGPLLVEVIESSLKSKKPGSSPS
uniref:Uncharacterized protein n=1 Tax=Anopheles farauti TaxID=69004 RepID=A0A182Q4U9_9DIPT